MTSITAPAVAAAPRRDGLAPQRWAVVAAHLVPLVVLPSSLWRLPVALGFGMGGFEDPRVPGWLSLYVLGLSLFSEGLALLTLGLVRPWGERVPSWMPLAGGRRVRPFAAAGAAFAGAAALMLLWGFAAVQVVTGTDMPLSHWGWEALFLGCYAPLLLWGPLLAVVTVGYLRRRGLR